MKLSVVDAMVLKSTRSPGESQMVAVNRRIRNFHAEQWETTWLEATRTSGSQRDRASQPAPAERERKLAAKVEALAAAGQAKKAARAVAAIRGPLSLTRVGRRTSGSSFRNRRPGRPVRLMPRRLTVGSLLSG